MHVSDTIWDGPADVVFTGGAVYTVDPARTWAQAVAVKDGRIVTVGTDGSVADLIGPKTQVHDLGDRMLLPGFQDAHVHPPSGGLEMLQCNLNVAYTREGYERIVADYASEHSDVEWIRGGGWSMDSFPGGTPTKEVLDRIVPDRPVYLPNRDGHGAWVNSRALELAGITRETPDPPDGRIERDADGDPSGSRNGKRASAWPSGTCTRSASPRGRTPSSVAPTRRSVPTPRRQAGTSSRRGSSGPCGGTGTVARSRSTSWSRNKIEAR